MHTRKLKSASNLQFLYFWIGSLIIVNICFNAVVANNHFFYCWYFFRKFFALKSRSFSNSVEDVSFAFKF